MTTIEATEPRIYRVPEVNYSLLQEDMKRLQRRAKKLGSEEITLNEVGYEDHQGYYVGSMSGHKLVYLAPGIAPTKRFGPEGWMISHNVRRYYLLTITGVSPKLGGWSFVGAIDLVRDEEGKVVGNMVRTLPDQEMPEQYRTTDPHCDHCGIARRWKSTYIVKHEDGVYAQVGRQCLKDFTGHKSPESLASMAEILMNISDLAGLAEDDDWGEGRGGRRRDRYHLEMILTQAATVIRTDGWVSKAVADATMRTSTAAMLRIWISATGNEAEKLARHFETSETDKQTAKDTVEWMRSLAEREKLSDYEHNLSLFALAGVVDEKVLGFVVSAIPAYMRAHDREVFAKKERAESTHVGQVKQRIEMVLTLAMIRYIDSNFGTRTMCKYRDENGNVVIWWASDAIDMAVGTKIKAKATIKEHSEYNGIKQTIVSRLAVIETLESPIANSQEVAQ